MLVASSLVGNMNEFDRLVQIVAQLRGPGGCPWDREQDHDSLKQYFLEEVYEALEAIDAREDSKLCAELGDVLLQILLHAQIAAEAGRFDIGDVVRRISEKLIYRHPHVFADGQVADSNEVVYNWEQLKRDEVETGRRESLLDGIPRSLPALQRAQALHKKVAKVGFDWDDASGPWAKLREELDELEQAVDSDDPEAVARELGDVLIAVVNLSRLLGVAAEDALRQGNARFEERFREIERRAAAAGQELSEMPLAEMDRLWEEAKAAERNAT